MPLRGIEQAKRGIVKCRMNNTRLLCNSVLGHEQNWAVCYERAFGP